MDVVRALEIFLLNDYGERQYEEFIKNYVVVAELLLV